MEIDFKREGFRFYRGFLEALIELPDKERLETYDAICRYGICDDEPPADISQMAKSIFAIARPNIDASIKRYDDGCKGGRPKRRR